MTAFRPGQSPPPVSTPTRICTPRLDRSSDPAHPSHGDYARAMTFSIVGHAPVGGPDSAPAWGGAVASKFLAVGNAAPAAVAGVGALATQADATVAWKGIGLSLLDEGATA